MSGQRIRLIVVPILILLIAGGIALQQRRETAANLVRIDAFLNALLEDARDDNLPPMLPVTISMLDAPIRNTLEDLARTSGTVHVESVRDGKRYFGRLSTDGALRLTLDLEVDQARIVISGYALPAAPPQP